MQSSRLAALSALLPLLSSQIALAETVRMKNGTVLHGAIVQMTESDLTLDTADMGQVVLKRRAIEGFDTVSAPEGAATVVAPVAPVAAAAPAIAINNNNNNNNAATVAAVATPAPAPMPAPTPAPVPEAKPAPAAIATAVQAESSPGFVMGKIAVGGGRYRLKKEWSATAPLLHWDVLGYHWDNGLSLVAFGEGIQAQKISGGTARWLQGGLRVDAAFFKSATRFGNANFYAGLGGTYLSMTRRVDLPATYAEWPYYGYSYEVSPAHRNKIESAGTGAVATFGYQVLGNGGLGIDVGLMASNTRTHSVESDQRICDGRYQVCSDLHPNIATASLTFGASYAL